MSWNRAGKWGRIGLAVAGAVAVSVVAVVFAGRTNPHLEALISQDMDAHCEDDAVRRGELEAAGDRAVPFLRSVLRRGPGPMERVASALKEAGVTSWVRDWISEPLANSLDRRVYERDGAKRLALHSLFLMGPAAGPARPELIDMMAYPPLGVEALAVLAATDPHSPVVTSNYLARMKASQGERLHLARHFPGVWSVPPPFLTDLIALLRDPDDDVRADAAYALASYGPAASNAIPQLEVLLSVPARRVQPNAVFALGMISPRHADLAVRTMLGLQRTNPSWTEYFAQQLYAALGPAAKEAVPSVREELLQAEKNGFTGPRAFALWRMTGEASPEVLRGLIRGVTQPIQRYQLMSLEGLKEIGPPASNAVPVVRSLLQARHRTLQKAAEETLRAITANAAAGPAGGNPR